ncbi:MAG: MerR family transcriptional regulator [Deltaproteobacteria bacterium]|nr:MerR family transcriptional regulator [Deltaproteobacteria bacterium]
MRTSKPRGARMMKIAELARRAGVSRETIHFYLREGLLPRPRKAGQTVAFYDDQHVERLLLVRRLREEKFLPISVIRRLLREGRVRAGRRDIELLSEISQLSPPDDTEDRPVAAVARELGVPPEVLAKAGTLGLVDPTGKLGPGDRRVLEAISEAGRGGPAAREMTLADMRLCQRHVERMVEAEARLFFDRLLAGDPGDAVAALGAGRAAVARFVAAYRARCLHSVVDRTLAEIDAGIALAGDSATRPLSQAARERGGYEGLLAELGARAAASGAPQVEALFALARLHFGVGDHEALASLLRRSLPPGLADDPRVLFFAGAARCELRDLATGLQLLAQAVALAPGFSLARAMYGATLLRALAARGGTPPSSGSVLADGTRGIAELDRAAGDEGAPASDRRWILYLGARVAMLLPPILGRRDAARERLEDLAGLEVEPADLEGVRLRGNARLALGLGSEDVVE